MDRDDIFSILCETYLEALQKYDLKPRTIPKRPFVFNYINFILMRMYSGQFKFDNRDVSCVDMVIDPDSCPTEVDFSHSEKNPYMFSNSYDLDRILSKYPIEDRLIIYYRFFLKKNVKELHMYLPSRTKVTSSKMKKLMETLKADEDLLNLWRNHD